MTIASYNSTPSKLTNGVILSDESGRCFNCIIY